MRFWNHKAHLQWHILFNKATLLPNNATPWCSSIQIYEPLGHSYSNHHSHTDRISTFLIRFYSQKLYQITAIAVGSGEENRWQNLSLKHFSEGQMLKPNPSFKKKNYQWFKLSVISQSKNTFSEQSESPQSSFPIYHVHEYLCPIPHDNHNSQWNVKLHVIWIEWVPLIKETGDWEDYIDETRGYVGKSCTLSKAKFFQAR